VEASSGRGEKLLRLLHTSDVHGAYKVLLRLLEKDNFDCWVDSGDLLPNKTRGDRRVEPVYQEKWLQWKGLGPRIAERLSGRPALLCPGNHDFIRVADHLKRFGVASHDLDRSPAAWGGEVWSGCRAVEWMSGEWNGEIHDFHACTEKMMASNPTVLVTHSPVARILDLSPIKGRNIGNPVLLDWLVNKPHRVRLVLHGHVHEEPGTASGRGITFVNSAETSNVIEFR